MDSNFCPIIDDPARHLISSAKSAKLNRKAPLLGSTALTGGARLAILGLVGVLMLASRTNSYALPVNGTVVAGSANIANTTTMVTVSQTSQNAVINWQSFSIGQNEAVTFDQPNSSSVTLNRVVGGDPSAILGSLSANGQVFLVNPNGILFAKGAQVNVGGLVASTLDVSNANFMAGSYKFAGSSGAGVFNQGAITAGSGGYVALLGAKVDNEGVITAQLGTVALAGGTAMTLDVAGNRLLNVAVSQGAVNALVTNGGLIQANGGQVLMTAQAAGALLKTVVNNTGVVEAQTVDARNGTIKLLGDMQSGTVNVGGTLDASAPNGGNGGVIETSAAQVNVAPQAKVTTASAKGLVGSWSIDPADFTIGSATGDNISNTTLSQDLVTSNITISTLPGAIPGTTAGTPPTTIMTPSPTGTGTGDINVGDIGVASASDAVSWTASSSPTTLTLDASGNVNINANITATKGNLVVCCGLDVNVDAAITTTNGSM
ncbi:hypothetical protein GCM10010909_00810 [Acidocella aquatica]|uniref:Filamentous haemagglutinin FhaB/tRNA nuclease CdiA-like TPS domain-containing protein n=1 Tax=Acidocella aquatica TaxID=1922313 RepID=A0ABQ6A5B5_9PROT|nr:filamentous hemagglutinin N-terminal domain-containing protein [Acidocella aquatica]GLR65403.1 hypothetical protein GCM10010909_00810 [Acidocella aquatica]